MDFMYRLYILGGGGLLKMQQCFKILVAFLMPLSID